MDISVYPSLSAYSVEQLLGALVSRSIEYNMKMYNDIIRDPSYVHEEGVPTRDKLVSDVVDHITDTLPSLLTEQADLDVLTDEDRKRTPFEQLLIACTRRLIERNPAMTTIRFQLSK